MSSKVTFSWSCTRAGSSLARALTLGERKGLGCLGYTCRLAGCEKQKHKTTEPSARYGAAAIGRTDSIAFGAEVGPCPRCGSAVSHLQSVEPRRGAALRSVGACAQPFNDVC